MYKAKNIDTDKVRKVIEESRSWKLGGVKFYHRYLDMSNPVIQYARKTLNSKSCE